MVAHHTTHAYSIYLVYASMRSDPDKYRDHRRCTHARTSSTDLHSFRSLFSGQTFLYNGSKQMFLSLVLSCVQKCSNTAHLSIIFVQKMQPTSLKFEHIFIYFYYDELWFSVTMGTADGQLVCSTFKFQAVAKLRGRRGPPTPTIFNCGHVEHL
jgi:hypothetical protein